MTFLSMKKILSLFSLLAVLLTASCSLKEDFKVNDSELATLSFTIGEQDGVATRAIGDGTTVDMLYYAVYDAGDNLIPALGQGLDNVTFPTTVDITLAKGQTYSIVFWAQSSHTSAYTIGTNMDGDLRKITISYDGDNNDESRDAFFKTITHTVTGDIALDVTLERPFAQVNLGVTEEDWNAAVKAGVTVSASKVVINDVANELDLFNGAVKGATSLSYDLANIPAEDLMVDLNKDGNKEAYKYLSLSYILVNDNTQTSDNEGMYGTNSALVSAEFTLDTEKQDVVVKVDNLPVRRNWRTNVIGEMLTGDITFNIDVDPIFDGDVDNYPDNDAERLYFAGLNGGSVTLSSDVVLEKGSIDVYKDMVVDLNGFSIRNLTDGDYCNVFVAYEGANLTIKDTKGSGVVETSASSPYAIPVWARGGNIKIYGGNYYSDGKGNGGSEVIYASGKGNVLIVGGLFEAKEQAADVSNQWLALNCHDASYRAGTANIVVKGGKFYKFNPANNLSEGANTNYVAENYVSRQNGDYWQVALDAPDYILYADRIEVYSAAGLLKWAYILKTDNTFKLVLMNDIYLPAFEVEENATEQTYQYTSTPVTVDNTTGSPSGSNWVNNFGRAAYDNGIFFQGEIEGNNYTIHGLRLTGTSEFVGFAGNMRGSAAIRNLKFEDAVVYSTSSYVGVAAGNCQNGSIIDNVHILNSMVRGQEIVGGVSGRVYTRGNNANHENLSVVSNCTTDALTKVVASSSNAGGICGYQYGALIIGCLNSADVTGSSSVGGVVGYARDYHTECDGYVIASGSTAEATVVATTASGKVGGVAGYTLQDEANHTNTYYAIVACFSEAQCENTILGGQRSTSVFGSWGVGTQSATPYQNVGNYLYQDPSQVTQADVDAMNAAIDQFNALNRTTMQDNILIQCDKKWSFVAGSWPVLQ